MKRGKENARLQREQRQLHRLQREQTKKKSPVYLYYMLFIISFVYIADEVTTQIGTQMQSILAQALFAPVFGADVALARMKAIGIAALIGNVLALPYKTLSDRYGRKLFLVINTFGMGLSLLFISVATNIPVYLLGAISTAFFTPHDMQVVYILESAPPAHRAKIFSTVKAVSTVGMMLIPLLRGIFMGEDTSKWRAVFFVCALFAMAGSFVSLLFVRESDVFVNERLRYLNLSPEARELEIQKKNPDKAQGGLIPAARFCMRHKQLRWIVISTGFIMWGMLITQYYEPTMTNGYAAQFLAQGMQLQEAHAQAAAYVTKSLFLFPIGSALFQLAQGFLSDKKGRKFAAVAMSCASILTYVFFCIGSFQSRSPYAVGFLCGAAVGSYWATTDISGGIMSSESTPTNLRSSVMTVQPVLSGLVSVPGLLLSTILINVLGDAYAGWIGLGVAIPGMLAGLTMLISKVHDTKSVNLNSITGSEWDE